MARKMLPNGTHDHAAGSEDAPYSPGTLPASRTVSERGFRPGMTPVRTRVSARQHSAPARSRPPGHWQQRIAAAIPYVMALFFCLSALRGVGTTDVIDTDAARHAMNGAFIHDWVGSGHWSNPVHSAKVYYAQYPALSMPYHPPLFPAMEAIFFAVFGVKLLTARLAVALCVAICAIILNRLVSATLKSQLLAACITVTTFSLWTVQYVARDVMLEFPSMVFVLPALYFLRDFEQRYTMRHAILFAGFAAAGVWTKQHAVFLGAVPFLLIVLNRRWRRLLEAPLWVGSVLFGAAVIGLVALSKMFHGTGVDQVSTSASDVYWIVTRTLPAYLGWIGNALKGVPGVFLLCAIGTYAFGSRKRDGAKPKLALYFAWIIAICALLVVLGPVSPRYLFFAFPAAVAIGYAWLFHGCRWLWGERSANAVALAFTAAWFVVGLFVPLEFLEGPGAAAAAVVHGAPARVLYIGSADGNFVFAVRALDPQLQVTVIPGWKLGRSVFEESPIDVLCRKYGIESVVVEKTPGLPYWSNIRDRVRAAGKFERSFPLRSTRTRWQSGTVEVYRFAVPPPAQALPLPASAVGAYSPLKL
jgi:4-amino-4-deoxy-L-arabinose transferase-like glycosyltransferase